MQDIVELRDFYHSYGKQKLLVLCTLVRKKGSSYRDVGAKKIVSLDGESRGLLSGGCLEASIEKMARERVADMPFIESFSTLSEEDRLMGYQTGCHGVIDILFEKMEPTTDLDLLIPFGFPIKAGGVGVTLKGAHLGHREFIEKKTLDETIFFEPWIQRIHLVIVGCGADADAYLPLSKSLGWSIQFLDHRRDLTQGRFPQENVEWAAIDQLASKIPQGSHIAVVLMTHNYEVDLEVMRGMKNHQIGYLGCLGPASRYERIKKDLKNMHQESVASSLDAVVHAPAGLFPHSRSPSEIALSVVAQIQGELVESTPHLLGFRVS